MLKFLGIGTIAAALTMFAWQTVSNTVLPWPGTPMREFQDGEAISRAIRAAAPENGVYFAPQGVLAAVAFTPDMADKSQMMGPMLGRQIVIDLAVALLLCLLAARIGAAGAARTGTTLAMAGLAVSVLLGVSDWNWYGFSTSFTFMGVADTTIQLFLAGAVIGWAARRFGAAPTAASSEEPVVAHAR